jgi:predicted permease
MARLDEVIVRLAAPIVPRDIRASWQREWEAELAWSRRRGSGDTARAMRALGAWPHACWLRRDRWRIDMLWHDITYAARTLIRRPGYALLAVLSLAIGIGANVAMFSAVHAVLLRPLPFPNPDQLVSIWTTNHGRPGRGYESTPPDFADWRRDTAGFTEMAAVVAGASALTGDGPAEQVPSAQVTGGFFTVFGVAPLHGRTLLPDDDPMSAPEVVALSHGLWRRRFGGDAGLVGQTIPIDGQSMRVVGVMPEGFDYPIGSQLWRPLRFTEDQLRTQRGAHYLDVVARLAPGVSLGQAREALAAQASRLAGLYPRTNADRITAIEPMRDTLVGDVRRAMLLMLGAVGFVLLIVCVNVASLALTRALGRQRELAVRTALGAGRARLVRSLLVESVLLAFAGGAAGLLAAVWATRLLAALGRGIAIPLLDQTSIDATVLGFTVALSGLTAILFGALPAWQASRRLDIVRGIREGAGATTDARHRQRLRAGLIVAETALAVVLLVGAGLLMRSFLALAAVDLGFRPAGVQSFSLSLPQAKYPTPASRAVLIETLLSRVSGRPDVEAAGAIFGLPLTNFGYVISMSTLDERKLSDEEQDGKSLQVRVVTPDYFRAMGIPLRRGRALGEADRLGAAPVVVINEAAAALLWPEEDAIGHSFTLGTRLSQGGPPVGGTVVGVVGDVRDAGPAARVRPAVYATHAQFPVPFVSVAVKARGEPDALVEPLRQVLADLDPELPMFRVRTMEQLGRDAVAQPRLFLTLLGVFASIAVLLAAVGIYGVLAHSVSQRTREIGVRLALGAERGHVMRMIVGQAMVFALAGLAIGLVLAIGAGRLMQSLLFGVEPLDGVTHAAVIVGLVATALVASVIPAVRAARVDPVTALRSE